MKISGVTKYQGMKDKNGISEAHKEIIDLYFSNGFNGVKTGLIVKPDMNYNSASVMVSSVLKKSENQAYIKEKQEELKSLTNIEHQGIVKELLNLAFSDITEFLNLTLEEIKLLPVEFRRTISSIDIKTTEYLPRGAKHGEEVTEHTFKIKLVDKMKAFDMINKYVGLYSVDNSQKQPKLNLENVNVENLNVLLQIVEQQKTNS